MPRRAISNRQLTQIIMVAVAIWGATLALGAFLYGRDPETGNIMFSINALRGLIVFGFVAVFLGFWALMLASQKSDISQDDEKYESKAIEGEVSAEPAKRPMSDIEFRGWLIFILAATAILFFEACVAMQNIAAQRLMMVAVARFGFIGYVLYALWQGNPFARWLIVGVSIPAGIITGLIGMKSLDIFSQWMGGVYVVIGTVFILSGSFRHFLNYQNEAE